MIVQTVLFCGVIEVIFGGVVSVVVEREWGGDETHTNKKAINVLSDI